MQKNKNRIISFALLLLLCTSLIPEQVKAASLLGTGINIESSRVGTYHQGGKYNFDFAWEKYHNDAYNYRLTVKRISDGKWVIITSLASGKPKTEYGITYYQEDIYGLRPDLYDFYISAYNSKGKVIDTHVGTRVKVTSSGAQLLYRF